MRIQGQAHNGAAQINDLREHIMDSAGGSAKKARDEKVDAILPVFGKIPNVYDKSIDKVISSDKIMMIVKALECGIGEDFDIENLAYHHVVILSD